MTCDVTYDVLGNERHKAVCELRKLPDGYPSYSAFPFAKWYEDLSTALGICKGEVSCAKVRDTLIHLLGGDQVPATHGDPYGIWKGDGDGMDAGGCVEACGDRSDAAADGHMADSAGGQVSEGVAPITTELREWWVFKFPVVDKELHRDFTTICDRIDAVNVCLERENAELREKSIRVAEADSRWEYAIKDLERTQAERDALAEALERAYEKNRNQRKQLTEVQEALHRRNEGELKARWQKEIDRLERENEELRRQNEELRRQLESLMLDSRPMTDENMAEHGWYRALDADKKPVRVGDKVDSDHYDDGTVTGIQFYEMSNGGIRTLIAVRPGGWDVPTWHTPDEYRHYHAPTVEDVLREFAQEMNENLGMYSGEAIDADEWRDADAKTIDEYAAKLRLADDGKEQ